MRTEAAEETPAAEAPPPKQGRRARRAAGKSSGGRYGQRILPKTVVGVVVLMLAAAIGFAFGGTVLYAYYQYKTDKLEKRVNTFVNGFEDRFKKAVADIDKGNLPRVKWAAADEQPQYGERIFDVAGVGGAGGSITQGFVADVSAAGVEHDAAVTGPFAGGPILNSKGEVLGVGTPGYMPLGFTSDRVTFAPFIRATCEKVLKCPANATEGGGAGERR